MPIQGSGSISLSELATEFGGQAPHSLTEYLKDAGLVDSTRAITGSESYTSLVTGDQVGTTGIYVNGVTVSHSTTNPTVTAQTTSENSGDDQFDSTSSENSSATFEDAASTITIAQGTYVNLTIKGYQRYETFTINGDSGYRRYVSFWGDKDGSGAKRDSGFTFSYNTDTFTTGVQCYYEITSGNASDWTIGGAASIDLSSKNRNNYSQPGSGTGWNARPTRDSGNTAVTNVTINGYANSAATIKVIMVMEPSSASFSANGPATGTDPYHGGTYDAFSFTSTLNMNAFKAYNTNSYALSCNGTNIPANTPSNSAVTFAPNLKGTSVTASITGNQPINSGVPSSGALSLTDFYSSEEQ